MRNIVLSAVAGFVGLGFAAAAQAGPQFSPIKTDGVAEPVAYGCGYGLVRKKFCHKVKHGYEHKTVCTYKCVKPYH